jgi:hypothetical protein
MLRARVFIAGLVLGGAGLGAFSPAASAATLVSPAAGSVAGPTPAFVVALAAGDDPLQIQVSTSAAQNIAGFSDRTGVCTPAVTGNRASCSLDQSLPDGTYYWLLFYKRNDKCVTVGSQKLCFPNGHLTAPVRFTVSSQAPPPAPPPPPPTTPPQPVPAPTPPGPTGKNVVARPTNGGQFAYQAPEQLYSSADAVVHYVTTGLDAPPLNDDNDDGLPDYVQEVGTAADAALGYYAAHRFLGVPADSGGPDAKTDIYIKHFQSPDLYGITINPRFAQGGTFVVISSHLDMSPKLARGSVSITVAHELFHVVQFGYVPQGGIPEWVAEGSATAASMLANPKVDDLTYADYFDEWLAQPWRPLFDEASYCDHCYGGGLWWEFLMEGDPGLIPDYFHRLAAIRASGKSFGLGIEALDQTMRAHEDGSLASVFAMFSVAVYRAKLAPRPTYVLSATRRARPQTEYLNGLAAHYVPIYVPRKAKGISVHLRTRAAKHPHAVLIVGGPSGRVVLGSSTTFRNAAERKRVMLVITNTQTKPLVYTVRVRS